MVDDILGPQETPAQTAQKEELKRRSQDRIRVFNPLDEEFVVRWEGLNFPVKARSTGILPRYIAINYLTHLIEKIRGEGSQLAVVAENKRKVSVGEAPMNVFQEQPQFEKRWLNKNTAEALTKEIWLGVEEEYGYAEIAQPESESSKPSDIESIIEKVEKDRKVKQEEEKAEIAAPLTMDLKLTEEDLAKMTAFEVAKIARRKGIITHKTDRKDDLIKQILGK